MPHPDPSSPKLVVPESPSLGVPRGAAFPTVVLSEHACERIRQRPRRARALLGLLAAVAVPLLAAPGAEAEDRTYVDTRTGEVTTFRGPEVAGTQTGTRSDGSLVQRHRDAGGVETWRNADGSREVWVQPDTTGTGTRTVLDPVTGEIHVLQEH